VARKPPNVLFALAQGYRRAFSRSARCARGALPVFAEPSSPDLQSLLADFNAKVLLPLHLNDDQQKLVYRQANRAKLEAEPVEITLGDVTLPLQHLDRNRLPKRWQHFRDIVMKSQTRNDWANVVRLLEGFENAGLRVRSRWQIMAVRQLNLAGMHSLVFQALQRVQATGLHLTDRGVLLQVLRGLHDKAATADWDKEETTQALRMTKQVVDLMEAKDHHAANRGEPPADRRGDPVVIALLTELTAVLAQRHGGDSSELAKLVNRLLTALVQTNFESTLKDLAGSEASSSSGKSKRASDRLRYFDCGGNIVSLIMVWNALKTSRAVLGADMPMADTAQSLETKYEKAVVDGVESLAALKSVDSSNPPENSFLAYVKDAVARCQ